MLPPLLAYIVGACAIVAAILLPPTSPGGGLRGGLQRAAALALASAALALPFLYEAPALVRTFQAGVLAVVFLRVVEIVRAPRAVSRAARVVGVLTLYDPRMMRPAVRAVPLVELALGAVLTAGGVGLFLLIGAIAPPANVLYELAGWPRWILGGIAGYVIFDGFAIFWGASLRPFGWEHEPASRTPFRSRTLGEFWGARWNRVAGRLFRVNAFEPLARRGAPRAGLVLAFVVSAALHFYMFLPVVGVAWAGAMGGFFVLHGVLTLIESRLGVRRWPPLAGRAFVVGVFVATLPLFVEPLLRGMGV